MFTCFAVNIMALAATGIDRYDAICRAPVRPITCRKTTYGLIFIWLFACCTAVTGGTGHILNRRAGETRLQQPRKDNRDPGAHRKISYDSCGVSVDFSFSRRHVQPVLRDCQVRSGACVPPSDRPWHSGRAEGSQTNENLRRHDCYLS